MNDSFWEVCFNEAWESYKHGSVPIGAVVIDDHRNLISRGRNRVNEEGSSYQDKIICRHKLAHAEINALLQFSHHDHPDIRTYTIYSTLEPCPLCFGAIVMSNVRNINIAAKDRYAGSTNIYEHNDYIKSKPINITYASFKYEILSIALNTDYALRNWSFANQVVNDWSKDCPLGTTVGIKLYQTNVLQNAKNIDLDIKDVQVLVNESLQDYK